MLTHRHILFGSYLLSLSCLIISAILFSSWFSNDQLFAPGTWLSLHVSPLIIKYFSKFLAQIAVVNPLMLTVLPYLIFFTLVSVGCILVLIVLIILIRGGKIVKERMLHFYIDQIQDLILDYLYEKDQITVEKLKSFPPGMVIDQINLLANGILGEKSEELISLFNDLGLNKYVSKKSRSFFWYDRLKYLPIASSLHVVEAKSAAEKSIDCYMPLVRNAAEIALINLDDSHSLDFLFTFNRALSDWHQLNIYHSMVRHSIVPPDFTRFLPLKNSTVISFALHMILLYNQKQSASLFYGFLFHQYYEIRKYAVIAIREFALIDAVPFLIKRYYEEDVYIQQEIIRTLTSLRTEEALDFLCELMVKPDILIRMEILKNLESAYREEFVNRIQKHSDINLLVRHITYNKL